MFQTEEAVRRKKQTEEERKQKLKIRKHKHQQKQGEVGEMSNRRERRKKQQKNNKRRGVNRDRSCRENEEISKENLEMCQKEGFHYFHKWTVILQHILLGIKCQS